MAWRMARFCLFLLMLWCAGVVAAAGKVTVAAASDLKFAMDEIVAEFRREHSADLVEMVYGSSGKFRTQIAQGAPFDLYFSADIAYPKMLAEAGHAASEVESYAIGRLVIWSATVDASGMTLADLAAPGIKRVAIANPRHAPYGQRAEEALRAAGVWDAVRPKLVFGENIAQAAQFVQTGNADVGVIALALALNPELASMGGHALVPADLHQPLVQGFIITRRAEGNELARRFASHVRTAGSRAILTKYGFIPAGD